MKYVDGFVAAVPKNGREAYLKYAKLAADAFKEMGALSVVECWGDNVPDGELTSFPLAVQCQSDETVVFAWITWASKEVREIAWRKMAEDPRFDPKINPMPFDGRRLIYGGFEPLFIV